MTRIPRAFRSDDPSVIIAAPEPVHLPATPDVFPVAPPRRFPSLGSILASSVLGLIGLWFVTSVEGFVRDMIARSPVLGWAAAALAFAAAAATLALIVRELRAIARAASISEMRDLAARALVGDAAADGRTVLAGLDDLYARRPETARGRARLIETRADVIDGADLVRLAERELMPGLDARAAAAISTAAKRVSVATAVAPRALLDVFIVGAQSLRLVRDIALIYGARPGTAGFLRILRAVAGHLVVTGGIAVGDSFIQQVVGHGLAARLSARLGEGVLNGLLTARVGLAALDVCRPLPFVALKRPGLRDVAGGLFEKGDEHETTAEPR